MRDAIVVEQLDKSYSAHRVLRNLNLGVRAGEVYGLLGPNGAGKSTLLHLLLGFLKPDAGNVWVLGTDDLERARARVGYIPERLRYHMRYTAREYLTYLGMFSGMARTTLPVRVEAELQLVGLSHVADRRLQTFSKGMLQRLGIAQALIHEPALLIIDEPSSGLDPAGQQEMIDLLDGLRQRGQTILLATHMLGEVEALCDRVGVLADGQIVAETAVAALQGPAQSVRLLVTSLSPVQTDRIERLSPAIRCQNNAIVISPASIELQQQVQQLLLDLNVPLVALEPLVRPLEAWYTSAVKRQPLPMFDAPPDGMFAPPGHPDALTTNRDDQTRWANPYTTTTLPAPDVDPERPAEEPPR